MSVISSKPIAATLLALATLVTTPVAFERIARAEGESQDGLATLLQGLAESPGLFAKFREEKQIALLATPLISSGTLHFAPKRGLARHTRSPSKESLLVTPKELAIWDGKKVTVIPTAASPTLKAFVEVLPLLLAANRVGIEKNFTLTFSGDYNAGWTLTLEPKGEGLRHILAHIELRGSGLVLNTLVVREANDDVSSTTFTDVDTKRKYSAAEAHKIFSLPR